MTTLFVTGIDTDIGKSIACGALAKSLLHAGHNLFTQKWVETGTNTGSQDLITHQEIAQQQFNSCANELHSPYLFEYPASPHLSARLENREISCDYLIQQTQELEGQCEHLIIEGAGGLCVPLNSQTLLVDLIAELKLPILLVTSGKLGSINHTLLTLEMCQKKGIEVRAIIYNQFPKQDAIITSETRDYLRAYLDKNNEDTLWLELSANNHHIDFSESQITHLLR